jgi:ribosomal protein S18 acetylase RimI-like enzyme
VTRGRTRGDAAARARAWVHAAHASVCDMVAPWEHGTVVRATRYPTYFDFNLVRVEDTSAPSLDALVGVADEALAGLAHRRITFEVVAAAEPHRPGLEALGWKATRLVWMRHAGATSPAALAVERVPYDAVRGLRLAWHLEEFPNLDSTAYLDDSREVAMRRNAEVFAVLESGTPVAFAQLERDGEAAEVTDVYVQPEHRGEGLGTAITQAAVAAAGDVSDLWIVADDDGRAKQLYARLGFRAVWTVMDFLRLGSPAAPPAGSARTGGSGP